MDEYTQIMNLDYGQIFLGIIAILIFLVSFVTLIEKVSVIIGKPFKWIKKNNDDHQLLMDAISTMKSMQETHASDKKEVNDKNDKLEKVLSNFMTEVRNDIKQFTENRVHDRKQSLDIQKQWSDKIEDVFKKLETMQKQTDERFKKSEAKTNKRVQSDIKDKIAQSYRRYDKTKQITSMELEALEDLIDTYETFGGENSFVHSVVQKEMYTWEKTSE